MRNDLGMLKVISKELSSFSIEGLGDGEAVTFRLILFFVSPLQGDFMDEFLFSRGYAIAPPRAVTFRPFRAISKQLSSITHYEFRTIFILSSRLHL